MKKLSCRDARDVDLVGYLDFLGYQPKKVRGQDYWYSSPFRQERTPSFKVNRVRNVWFDFGEGKGGDLIDFGVRYFGCRISELLEQLSSNSVCRNLSFDPPSVIDQKKTSYSKVLILKERALTAPALLQYIQNRCIPLEIAGQYCLEIDFRLYGKIYTAIGFKNDKGGFELRNKSFKGSSSPKASTFFDRGSNEVAVFEGFFDFLSFQTLQAANRPTNLLILNSLAFFHQAKDLMDKHQIVNLYLDNNKKGLECTRQALRWDRKKYKNHSRCFRKGEDLNDWLIQKNASHTASDMTCQERRQCHKKNRRT